MAILPPSAIPKITELSNGLKVATIQAMTEFATVGFWVKAGSMYDTVGGTAHFLEHIIVRGNDMYPGKRLERLAEEKGINVTAATSQAMTWFMTRAESSQLQHSVDALAQIVLNPSIKDETVEDEKATIIQEAHTVGHDIYEMIWEFLMGISYPESQLGKPILGTLPMIKGMSADVLRDFHKKFFCPSNTWVVCASKLEHEKVVEAVEKATQFVKRRPILDMATIDREMNAQFKSGARVAHVPAVNESWLAFGFDVPPVGTKGFAMTQMVTHAIGESGGARVFDGSSFLDIPEIRRMRATCMPFGKTSMLGFVGTTQNGCEKDLVQGLYDGLAKTTVMTNEEDLKTMRIRCQLDIATLLSNTVTIANDIGASLVLGVPWMNGDEWDRVMSSISVDDMNDFGNAHFAGEKQSLVVFSNDKSMFTGQQDENQQAEPPKA